MTRRVAILTAALGPLSRRDPRIDPRVGDRFYGPGKAVAEVTRLWPYLLGEWGRVSQTCLVYLSIVNVEGESRDERLVRIGDFGPMLRNTEAKFGPLRVERGS